MKLRVKLSLTVAFTTAISSALVAGGVLFINFTAGIDGAQARLNTLVQSVKTTTDDQLSVALANSASQEITLAFREADGTVTVLQDSAGSIGAPNQLVQELSLGDSEKLIFALSVASVYHSLQNSIWLSALLSSLAALFAGLLVWLLMARDLSLVLRLIENAKSIAAGAKVPIAKPRGSRELRELADALEDMVNRLQESKDQMQTFLSDASHELRTPLTVIRGYLEILAKRDELDAAQVTKAIERAQGSTVRMQKLINDLLQLAELGEVPTIELEPVILADIYKPMLEDLKAAQPKRALTVADGQQSAVLASPEQLTQLFSNAFANLRAHTPEDAALQLTVTQSAVGIQIDFEDAGPGIDGLTAETARTVFKRFDESHASRDGSSGLGLSIMSKIVELQGGELRLTRSQLGGLCVSAFLPTKNANR